MTLSRFLGTALLLAAVSGTARAGDSPSPVASPDWRDQVIYFVMIDRFNNGDPGNDDQGTGEFDPANPAKYSGGDLQGIRQRLDYIRGLGATTIWITPPVANQWWNDHSHYGGYHGYWAENFMKVDAHFGSLADYQALARDIHGAGMTLIQDIVVNHTADYFHYPGDVEGSDPTRGYERLTDTAGHSAPTQWPFSQNDLRDPKQRAAAIYHWTPEIVDFNDPNQLMNYQLANLDDLNTENPVVRKALRESYDYWIKQVGVDGFRVDTAFYVPPDYFADFLYARDKSAPGVMRAAAETGRNDFLVFGEGFGIDKAYDDTQEKRIDRYMRGSKGEPLMNGMLNFPLFGTANEVFARGRPTAELGYRIGRMMALHAHPERMPTFLDNHDVDRFLANGDVAALKQGLLMLMTLPGIPTIYAGTEQGFTGQRDAMFKGGYGSGGRDHFDTNSELYKYLKSAIALRRENPMLSRGTPTVMLSDEAGPGVFAYRMDYQGQSAFVMFNTSTHDVLVDKLPTGLDPGQLLVGLFAIGAPARDAVVGRRGLLTKILPPRSGQVWLAGPAISKLPPEPSAISFESPPPGQVDGNLIVGGQAPGRSRIRLVVDGNLTDARIVNVDPEGHWLATVDTSAMIDPGIPHRLVAMSADGELAVSDAEQFKVSRQWTLLADAADPADDDHGPAGHYRYPSDPGWGDNHQLDIRGVRAWRSGGALKLELRMAKVSALWNPPNGFDHVAFTLYFQVPGLVGGSDVMPLQNARLPDGMRWNRRLRAGGWALSLTSNEGATATMEGKLISPAPGLAVDATGGTITFTIPAASLGNPGSLSGLKLYATTWDYDGGYRPLQPEPGGMVFGGGQGGSGPLVMDATTVITLP
jgi:glycosidase